MDQATSENCPKRKANFAEAASSAPTRCMRLGSFLDRAFLDLLLSRHLPPLRRRLLLPRRPPGPRRPSSPRPYLAPFSGTPLGSFLRRSQANSPNYLRPNGLSFTFTPHRYHDARSASVAHPHRKYLSEYLVELPKEPRWARLSPFASERDRYASHPNAQQAVIKVATPADHADTAFGTLHPTSLITPLPRRPQVYKATFCGSQRETDPQKVPRAS